MVLNTDALIDTYFNQRNILINHQIQSYNFYIDEIIPQIMKQYFLDKLKQLAMKEMF